MPRLMFDWITEDYSLDNGHIKWSSQCTLVNLGSIHLFLDILNLQIKAVAKLYLHLKWYNYSTYNQKNAVSLEECAKSLDDIYFSSLIFYNLNTVI